MQLIVEDLSFSFGSRQIFAGVSFQVTAKQLWHIDGDNGCGKSTLLLSLLGILRTSSGSVKICPEGSAACLDLRHHASFVPPDANGLWGSLSASDNLLYWSQLQIPTQTPSPGFLADTLRYWGLSSLHAQQRLHVDRFSTGMKRRLCFARLSLLKTWLWILDEPFFGLDKKGIEKVVQAIEQHLQLGGACIMVTHDTQVIRPHITHTLALQSYKKLRQKEL